MGTGKYFDNYSSTLSAGYTAGGTSLSVTSATGLPTVGNFYITIDRGTAAEEVFLVTAITGTTLTVTGAQANTTNVNHANGAVIDGADLTKGLLDQIRSDQNRVLTGAQFTALTSTEYKDGDTIRISDGMYRVVRANGIWNYFHGDFLCTVPNDSVFSWVNQGSCTVSTATLATVLHNPSDASLTARIRSKTAPATPYFIDIGYKGPSTATMSPFVGFRESSSGKINIVYTDYSSHLWWQYWSSPTTAVTNYQQPSIAILGQMRFFRLRDDGTNRYLYMSEDGQNWVLLDSRLRTADLTPDQLIYGVFTSNTTTPGDMLLLHWKQT